MTMSIYSRQDHVCISHITNESAERKSYMMINIAEKVPCDLKDCIFRHIFLVGAGSEPWGRPMTNLCQALK